MTKTEDQAPTSAVAVWDPAEEGRKLVREVEHRKPQYAALLGVDPETDRGRAVLDRFVSVALHATTSRPDLLRATRESLLEALRDSAMLGLEPVGVTGDGFINVYDEKVKREKPSPSGRGLVVYDERVPTARFQPMYRGLLKLARRSGDIAHIDAHVVYEGDEIAIDLGSVPTVRHFPVLDGTKRGDYVGAYAVAELANGRRYVDWMTKADIELVRRKSRAKDAMAWTDFWPEMARKTVLRRLMKRLPLETLAEHAIRIESEAEDRAVAPVATVTEPSDARNRLRARFGAATDQAEPTGEEGGTGEGAASDPEADSDAASTDPAVSVDPSEAEEGESRSICGAESDPKLGEVEVCVLEPGHLDVADAPQRHQSKAGTIWPKEAK